MNLDAILILTNQCNLKCAYCIYACDLNPDPYFITLNELNNTLILMKQKLPSLKRLILSGGDAFMHPQIIQICEAIRKVFPDIELCAYTNGLLLNKFSDENILYLVQQLNLNIVSSLYPSILNLNEYKNQDNRFKKLGINLYYQFSHFYFNKQNYKYHNLKFPKEIIDKHFYNNCHTLTKYNNLITIYCNKILVCCGEVGYLNNNNVNINDLLDLTDLKSEQQIIDFCEKPHNICKDCVSNAYQSNYNVLWTKRNELTQKYQKNSLESIFIKNYSDYKNLYLNNNEHLICYQDNFFQEKMDSKELNYLNIKYKDGIADIFIPYDNSFNKEKQKQLYDKLLTIPDIDKYNLYFVGIKTSSKYNRSVFRQFYFANFDSKIKATFLLGDSLIRGYEEFSFYSYLNNKIFLDINNFLISGQVGF